MIPTFIHVPRTAGTTLREAIARHYDPKKILTWDDSTTLAGWAEECFRRPQPMLIMGHLPYDFPRPRPFSEEREQRSYFTFLRDPIQRILSDYHWTRQLPLHRFREHCQTHTLPEAIAAGAYINLDNLQVRMFANAMTVPFGKITGEHLDRAITNLMTQFAYIGLTERLTVGVEYLEEEYGWTGLRYQLVDRNRIERPHTVDDPLKDLLVDSQRWDLSLYRSMAWHYHGVQ